MMARTRQVCFSLALAVVALGYLSGCDSNNEQAAMTPATAVATATATTAAAATATSQVPTPSATATATSAPPSATPTTQVGGLVSGLIVLRQDVAASGDDALAAPPQAWMESPEGSEFDRALSHADWTVSGPVRIQGATGADGRFEIPDLPPGSYTLDLNRSLNGNLVHVSVPFVVGDDGGAELVIEIGLGLVRSTSIYRDGGETVTEVSGPDQSKLVMRGGVVRQLGRPGQMLVDSDGDGTFEPVQCVDQLWLCDDPDNCGPDRRCTCTASCPFCEDCGPLVCAPPQPFSPYRCLDDGECAQPGDRCVCVSSCPECDDCALSVCVPSCEPKHITGLEIDGFGQLVIGRRGSLRAYARLDDGSLIDVTYLAAWVSSDEGVASVDSWGSVSARALGTAEITASLAGIASEPWEIEVVERPALTHLWVQNSSCYYPRGIPDPTQFPDDAAPPLLDIGLLPPTCQPVVRIGGTLQFVAFGEFADGHTEDLTKEVDWSVEPAGVGEVTDGLFRAVAEGTANVRAALGNVTSDPYEVRVVSKPTVIDLSIYAIDGTVPPVLFPDLPGTPPVAEAPFPCFDCGFLITVLRGDVLHFQATARYDTGEWEDVTGRVTWRGSDGSVATINENGEMTAVAAGEAAIDATLDEVTSNAVDVRVVDEATLISLYIYQDGRDRVVAKGDQAFFVARADYDVGFGREVTEEATWRSSDESIGGFDAPGVFTGRGAGTVEVWAELDGKESAHLPFEVFETSDIEYCDPDHVNRGLWSDAFNRVTLESDCAQYTPPGTATLRFTVTERERPVGVFDPCLDLFVFQGNRRVRTIREEGCGVPFLAPGAPEFDAQSPRYQTRAFWDLKDDQGNVVPPGVYTIYGRFYLYFDPVVSIDIAVVAPDGRIPCVDNSCGNGCGYVHACGDTDAPLICPTVCVPLCECPPGWGITEEGDCEPCENECCPADASCLPNVPPCEPVTSCCPRGDLCIPELPPCEQLECCPPNARCLPGIPPCEPCCGPDGICIPELPPCDS